MIISEGSFSVLLVYMYYQVPKTQLQNVKLMFGQNKTLIDFDKGIDFFLDILWISKSHIAAAWCMMTVCI